MQIRKRSLVNCYVYHSKNSKKAKFYETLKLRNVYLSCFATSLFGALYLLELPDISFDTQVATNFASEIFAWLCLNF